jgi:hypothetical protein
MRDRLVRGRVVRVDPAVTAGAVKVEVDFDEPLPTQARADLSVDGTIAIETLKNVATSAARSARNPTPPPPYSAQSPATPWPSACR